MRWAIFIAISFLIGCDSAPDNEEKPPLEKRQFTALMIDVQLAEGMKTQKIFVTKKNPGAINMLYEDIFAKHGVTEEEFQKTFRYYRERPELFEVVYEQVLDSLSKLDVEVKQEYGQYLKHKKDSTAKATRNMPGR